ncbi:hypothetical protein LCM17_21995 [Cereibacter sphaeroides]|nr:hypothetical protein [Cereibacter sphaeroides]
MRRIKTLHAVVAAVLVAFLTTVAPPQAQAQTMSVAPDALVGDVLGAELLTELARRHRRAMRQWVSQRDEVDNAAPVIAFRTPAEIRTEIQCRMGPNGISCFDVVVDAKCPSVVNVQLPDGGTMPVAVSCTGPDANGVCDCEFPN